MVGRPERYVRGLVRACPATRLAEHEACDFLTNGMPGGNLMRRNMRLSCLP
jgi:hypothetical protein